MTRTIPLLLFACALLAACNGATRAAEDAGEPLVLTSLAPVHALTQTLAEGTGIRVENLPERPRAMASQTPFFRARGETFSDRFESADAVVAIGRTWSDDPLYTTARQFNIRIVNIDASRPWSFALTGVAVRESPVDGDTLPHYWLSIANAITSLNIIAADLQELFPSRAEAIAGNLASAVNELNRLKTDFELEFIEVLDPVVYSLAEEFAYLTNDLGIFVDGYLVKQDIDWTQQDLAMLTERLQQGNIPVVIHKWEPSEQIRAAIEAGGAELVVLDTLETGTGSYRERMAANLDKLLAAFTD